MSRGGLKPETVVRKQLERRTLRKVCRLKHCGATYRQIAKKLGCSPTQAHRLVHEGIDAFAAEAKKDAGEMIEEMIAKLLVSSRELWIQWERSKHRKQRITEKTTADGVETTKMREGRLGDPRYMAEFRANMETIAKLRGVFSDDKEQADIFEEYQEEMDSSFDPPPRMIEGRQEQITNGGDPHN